MDIDTYIYRNVDMATRLGREVRMSPDAWGFTVRGVVVMLRARPDFVAVTRTRHPLGERVNMRNGDLWVLYPFGVYADDLYAV